MKKIFKYTLLLAFGALISCTNEYEYDGTGTWNATENYSNVAFEKASEEIELEPTVETKYEFTMTRKNTDTEVIVPFVIEENTDDVFKVGEVKFAVGDSVATGVVTFDNAEVGKPYTLKLAVTDPNLVSDYSKGIVYSLTINRVKWNPAGFVIQNGERYDGYAMYTEDIFTTFFSVENLTYPVKVQERDDMPGYFRVINPYGESYPYNEEGDYDPTVDSYIIIDATDPDKVYIPKACYMATDWGYGQFVIWDFAGYYLNQDDAASAEPYFGTYKNGKITFPAGSLLLAMTNYNSGGLYGSNGSGLFALVIDPTLDPYKASIKTDFKWEALYNGAFTSEQLGSTGNANLYKGTCVVNTDACDSVFTADYGTAYYIESPYTEGYNLYFSVLNGKVKTIEGYEVQSTGIESMGAEVFAKINQGTSSFSDTEVVLNITFQNEDGSIVYGTANETLSNITYTPVGVGTYTYVALVSSPASVPGFTMSKRDDKEDVYMIEQWFAPFGGSANLTFTWNKKDNTCTIPTQTTSLDIGEGEIFISDLAYYTGKPEAYGSYPCTFDPATNTFSFTVIYHLANGGYYNNPLAETFVVEFNEAANSAKVVKQSINKWELIMGTPKNGKRMNWKSPFVGTKTNFKSMKTVKGPVF